MSGQIKKILPDLELVNIGAFVVELYFDDEPLNADATSLSLISTPRIASR